MSNLEWLLTGLAAFSLSGAAAPAQMQPMTEGQILEIVQTANEGEVDMSKLANSRAENKEVKEYAKMMVDAHKKNEKEGKKVSKKTKIEPADHAASETLENTLEAHEKDLKRFSGAEFDKAYMQQQITLHEQLLKDLDQKLIPAAKTPELRAYLETTKSRTQEHLSKAQQIQSTLLK